MHGRGAEPLERRLTAQQARQIRLEREEKGDREDNRFRRRELANRDSVMALREYAPGAQVVMDGLVYRSAGDHFELEGSRH